MMAAVAIGGATGSVLRFLVTAVAQSAGLSTSGFPWWTLAINVTGSFVLGFFSRYFVLSSISPPMLIALTVGFCGGYTTFSTFSYEMLTLAERGLWIRATAYAAVSVVLGFAAVFLGAAAGRGLRAGV
jgi:CrcB protein